MGVASMPMYDLPEVRPALAVLWTGLARNLRREGVSHVPEKLVHDRPLSELWGDPALLFSQCCGYDLVNLYADELIPIATPGFAAPECDGRDYASVIVVHEDCAENDILAMRGAICAINDPSSHSGMNALRALVAPASTRGRFFSHVKVSGTHANSLALVKRGDADVAAIDCVTHALLKRHRPAALSGTRKLGETDRAPGIPFVVRATVAKSTIERMQVALFRTFDDPQLATVRQALLLEDVEVLPLTQYARITEFQKRALRHGYPELI
jgi:ABC-type phosphate/phosphonate transport system substrate-binding protein